MMLVGELVIVHAPALVGLKPLPVIDTAVLNGPELGLRIIVGVGFVTVNVAVAKSVVLPVTLIV